MSDQSNYRLNELMKINEEKARDQYYRDNPDSLIPQFEQEVQSCGIKYETVNQIVSFVPKYKDSLIPIAVKYYNLSKNRRSDNEQNFFLSFFCVKGLDNIVPMLLDDFKKEATTNLTRWFISDCLYKIRSRLYIDDYLKIAADSKYGNNRQMIILLLGSLKDDRAIPVLLTLVDDRDVTLHVIIALGNYKNESFRCIFEKYATSDNSTLRKNAKKALEKLDKKSNSNGINE